MRDEILIELGIASAETKGLGEGDCGESPAGPFVYATGVIKENGDPC